MGGPVPALGSVASRAPSRRSAGRAGIVGSQGRDDFNECAPICANFTPRCDGVHKEPPSASQQPPERRARPEPLPCSDDVEQYFNYMGCLAVEGTYDRMYALQAGETGGSAALARAPPHRTGCGAGCASPCASTYADSSQSSLRYPQPCSENPCDRHHPALRGGRGRHSQGAPRRPFAPPSLRAGGARAPADEPAETPRRPRPAAPPARRLRRSARLGRTST